MVASIAAEYPSLGRIPIFMSSARCSGSKSEGSQNTHWSVRARWRGSGGRSIRYTTIAFDSHIVVGGSDLRSTMVGMVPSGLIRRNASVRVSPLGTLTSIGVYAMPRSSSAHRTFRVPGDISMPCRSIIRVSIALGVVARGTMRCMPRWSALALVVACSSATSAPPTDAAVEEDTAVKPPIDPARFDCTAAKTPARRSTVPEACLRDPTCKTRLVVGHRGAGGDLGRIAPEDTLAAYRAAIVMGADLVETDPRPTKDSVIVNIHDPTLERTTNGTGRVDEMTYEQLSKLTIKTELPGNYGCERIPTLKEILELCKGRALVLVDANKTARVDLLVQAIRDANAVEWAVFDTSDLDKIDQALMLEPKLMIQPRVHDVAAASTIATKYKTHLPVFVEIDSSIFPRTVDVVRAMGTRVLTNAFVIDISVKLGSPPSRYLELYDKGADALQSDLPDLVLTALGRPPG